MRVTSLTPLGVLLVLVLVDGSEVAGQSAETQVQNESTQNEYFTALESEESEEEHEKQVRVARSPWGFRLPKIRFHNPFKRFRARRSIPRINFGGRRRIGNIGRNIGNAAKKIGRNVNKGARNIARNVDKGARKIAKNTDKGARSVARNVAKAAQKIAKNTDKGARNIGRNADRGSKHAARNVKMAIKQLSANAKGFIRKAGEILKKSAKKAKEGEASTTRRVKEMMPKIPEDLANLIIDYLQEQQAEQGHDEDDNDDGYQPTSFPTITTSITTNSLVQTMSPEATEPPCRKKCFLKNYAKFFAHSYCAFYSVKKSHGDFFLFRSNNKNLTDDVDQCTLDSLYVFEMISRALNNMSIVTKSKHDMHNQCVNGTLMERSSPGREEKLFYLKSLKPCEGIAGCNQSDRILKEAISQAITLYGKETESFLEVVNHIKKES